MAHKLGKKLLSWDESIDDEVKYRLDRQEEELKEGDISEDERKTEKDIEQETHGCSKTSRRSISSATFQKDGSLIIVFNESETNDPAHGGGHVAAFIISPKAKQGHQSIAMYQHQSALRLILHGLGIQTYPAAASTAPEMSEFF
jgi:hypothetical protein